MEPTDKERGARLSQLIGDGMDAAWEEGHKRGVRDTETRIAALVLPVVEEMLAAASQPEYNSVTVGGWADRIEKAIAGEGRERDRIPESLRPVVDWALEDGDPAVPALRVHCKVCGCSGETRLVHTPWCWVPTVEKAIAGEGRDGGIV